MWCVVACTVTRRQTCHYLHSAKFPIVPATTYERLGKRVGGHVTLFYSTYIIRFEAGAIQINLTILFAFDQEVSTLRSTTNLTDIVFPMVTMCNLPDNSGEARADSASRQ